jgi:Lhr-like helicase
MNSTTLDMFEDKADEESAQQFTAWVKEKADEIGVTEDYYLLEFL